MAWSDLRRKNSLKYAQRPQMEVGRPCTMGEDLPKSVAAHLGQLLCWIGLHDLDLIEVVGGFGMGGQVEKLRCKRCGRIMTRCAR